MDHQANQEESQRNERELYHLINSDGWAVVKDIINNKMSVLRDVTKIPTNVSDEQLVRETSGRIYALALVDELLSEIDARVDNFIASHEPAEDDDDIVLRQ